MSEIHHSIQEMLEAKITPSIIAELMGIPLFLVEEVIAGYKIA